MNRCGRHGLAMGVAMLAGGGMASAEEPAPASWEIKPEVAGIVARVAPLEHPMPAGWHPTLYWWQARLSFSDPAKLKEELRALSARGLLPCIELNGEYATPVEKVDESVAQAKAVADAGFPVHLAMKAALNLYKTPDGSLICHTNSPDMGKKDAVGNLFCCLPLKEGWRARAEHLDKVFGKLVEAKVPVAGVWYDYEGNPTPWNGQFEHSRRCPGCRQEIPANVLEDRGRFVAWARDLWREAMAEAFAKPVRKAFPAAKTGFYGYVLSSEEHPTMVGHLGLRYPPSGTNPPAIDFVMPVCYAWVKWAKHFFNDDWPVDRLKMDAVYMATLLRGISNHHWHLRPDQTIMPFVSSLIPPDSAGYYVNGAWATPWENESPRMSKPLYREFLRHAILRGARGFYCYNVAPPYGSVSDYYEELADINAVYNELFAPGCREFLEGGSVMNDAWPDPEDANAVVWSGLAKGDKAFVRVVNLGQSPTEAEIVVFPGQAIRLTATPEGRSYIVDKDGGVQAND